MSGQLRAIRRVPGSLVHLVSDFVQKGYRSTRAPSIDEDRDAEARSSLLEPEDAEPQSRESGGRWKQHGGVKQKARFQWYILVLMSTLMILTEFADFLSVAPQTQIFSDIACKNYYGKTGLKVREASSGTEGMDCRAEPVQSELALVDGWKETFDQLPGILLAIPYGVAADRAGRKTILILGQFGLLMSDVVVRIIAWWSNVFPLRLIWFGSLFRSIGGGNQVHNAMIFVFLADTFDEKGRADAFFKLLAAILISEITAHPISAILMGTTPWLPYLISPFIMSSCILIAYFFVPETLPESVKSFQSEPVEMQSPPQKDKPASSSGDRKKKKDFFATARDTTRFLYSKPDIVLLLFCFFVATVGRKCMTLLIQYVYKKFGWTFAQASYLISLRGGVNLFQNLVLLPLASRYLLNTLRLPAPSKDLLLSRITSILLTLGCLLIGVAGGIPLLIIGISGFALGNSFFLTARSLVTSLVPPTHVGTLYTAIGQVSGVGVLIAGPTLAYSYKLGMLWGENWYGLPYFAASVLFLGTAIAAFRVRLGRAGVGNSTADGIVTPDMDDDR